MTVETLALPGASTAELRKRDRPSHVPVTLYRVQMSRQFRFDDLRETLDYFAALGVTDCYLSPILRPASASTHGYDVSDHGHLNPDLGDEAALHELSAALRARGMGLVMDLVPNHMSVDARRNQWWRDVLENGPSSVFARYFDIDWTPVKRELEGKVLLPILGDQYGIVLERGDLALVYADGGFTTRYGSHLLPVDPRSSGMVLRHELDALERELGPDNPARLEFLSVLTALQHLPPSSSRDADAIAERHREKEVARSRLARTVETTPAIRAHVDRAVTAWTGTPGKPASFDRLHELLEAQNYRLSYWRTAAHEINYRRFFDVNELAGIRMEEPEVFEHAHALVLRLIGDGIVTGLRLDHPDGLADPVAYVAQLQERVAAMGFTGTDPARPLYIAVEKILSPGESLLDDWAVHGTTTYRFLNLVNSLFVDASQASAMRRVYTRLTGQRTSFAELTYQSKRLIMRTSMASELNVLAHALNDLSESDRRSRDFTLNGLRTALLETVACFPTYRTYVSPRGIGARDRDVIETALARARRRNPALEATIFDFLRSVLLPPEPGSPEAARDPIGRDRRLAFAMKLQQYTGPVHAKGVEDTAFYRHNVLVSLNEVGGDPAQFGRSPDEFHASNLVRQQRWPLEMIGMSTHDTKRGADVRARIDVLSEIPDAWARAVRRWMRLNASARTTMADGPAPDRNDEYLFYQTLVGVWPPEAKDAPLPTEAPRSIVDRVMAYMQKAIKEAKIHTSWVSQDEAYETALRRFVERTLTGAGAREFLATFLELQRPIAKLGLYNSLSQIALTIASPGVVDLYQGSELWDLSLVDPDNRRPVDFAIRRDFLRELEPILTATDASRRAPVVTSLHDAWQDGRLKLFVLASLLRERRAQPSLFLEGSYEPLAGTDDVSWRHIVAFARRHGRAVAIAAVPRLVRRLLANPFAPPLGEAVWGDSGILLPQDLGGSSFVHVVTGEIIAPVSNGRGRVLPAADVFRTSPVALLVPR
jgi:(1->4)-alpha-D-glucan 1-alpha-D-glucosylmutase